MLLSNQSIDAIVEAVSGGSGSYAASSPCGAYRTGPALERLCSTCGIDLVIGRGSRLPSLRDALALVNAMPDAFRKIGQLLECALDPRDFIGREVRLSETIEYLNRRLSYDGFEIRPAGKRHRLVRTSTGVPAVTTVSELAQAFNLEHVQRETERALAELTSDPADAITAACSMVESTCRVILRELGLPLPQDKDLGHLYKEVQKSLKLSPERLDVPEEIAPDVKQILGGLANAVSGIGALRTHAGDAHGKDRNSPKVDARIARLAVHAASTITVFLIETWRKRGTVVKG